MNQDYYQKQWEQSQENFWITFQRLIEQGHGDDIKNHPDYIVADQRCLKATQELANGSPDE